MKNECCHEFNMQLLLRLRDLDIRGISANHASLLVNEYFTTLTKFLDNAPAAADALTKISNLAGDEKAYQVLADAKALLTGIGYNRLVPVIDAIIDAGENHNEKVASICAKSFLKDFNGLYKHIKTAQKINVTKIADTGTPLKLALEQLDYEEANRKLRILAVDDAAFMLTTIKKVLSNDYEVFALTKATLVKKFLLHTTPELFLLDYNMPELSGFDLVPIIRSFEEHKDTPIIFLTAMGTVEHVSTAISLGACDYVIKPLNSDILLEKIAKHIIRKTAF